MEGIALARVPSGMRLIEADGGRVIRIMEHGPGPGVVARRPYARHWGDNMSFFRITSSALMALASACTTQSNVNPSSDAPPAAQPDAGACKGPLTCGGACDTLAEASARLREDPDCALDGRQGIGTCGSYGYIEYSNRYGFQHLYYDATGQMIAAVYKTDTNAFCGGTSDTMFAGTDIVPCAPVLSERTCVPDAGP